MALANTAERRPLQTQDQGQPAASPPASQPTRMTFGQELKAKEAQFAAALPAHIPSERFMRVVLTAVQQNPELLQADRHSLLTSSLKAAHDGLLPDGREGALVIYKTKLVRPNKEGKEVEQFVKAVQWMPMVQGIRKKARNSGEIATWEAHVVHARDEFEFELGDESFLRHKPFLDGDPGPVICAYSVCRLKSGEISREVMTKSQIDKVQAMSKASGGPWKDHYEEMARKTVARRHSKVLPMSPDLDDLIRRDDALYDLEHAKAEAKAMNGGKGRSLASTFDALSKMPDPDPSDGPEITEDGEIIEAKTIEHHPARQIGQVDTGPQQAYKPAQQRVRTTTADRVAERARQVAGDANTAPARTQKAASAQQTAPQQQAPAPVAPAAQPTATTASAPQDEVPLPEGEDDYYPDKDAAEEETQVEESPRDILLTGLRSKVTNGHSVKALLAGLTPDQRGFLTEADVESLRTMASSIQASKAGK